MGTSRQVSFSGREYPNGYGGLQRTPANVAKIHDSLVVISRSKASCCGRRAPLSAAVRPLLVPLDSAALSYLAASLTSCYNRSRRTSVVHFVREEYAMEITLPPEIEAALTEEARQQGKSPEQLALESLRQHFVAPRQSARSAPPEGTLADLLAGSIGVLQSREHVAGGAKMSETKSTAFAEGLLKKRQQGRL